MSHGDKVTELPPGFEVIGSTASAPVAAMADDGRGFYGIQFHPEVTHTAQGKRIIICAAAIALVAGHRGTMRCDRARE